jgi:pre-60S factor REI1
LHLGNATNTASGNAQASAHDGDEIMESDDEAEYEGIVAQCLFCNYISPTLDLNINHMGRQHGFFVPEKDYLTDLSGLVNYLSETIHVLRTCLFCHKAVHTAIGVQTHMRDRGHCMIAYSTEDEQMEIGEFYDFTSTYSDDESDEEEEAQGSGGVTLGVKRTVKTTLQGENGEDAEMDEDDDGWESDGSLSSVPTDEITSVPIEHRDHNYAKLDKHRHHSHTDTRPHKNSDGFHSRAHHTPTAVYHDDYELHLPSGRTAGHRSLKTYYRQNLRNYPSAEERAQQQMITNERHNSDAEEEAANNENTRGRQVVTRANGGLGMIGVSDAKKKEARALEKRQTKQAEHARRRYEWGNNKQANSQKHFRDPLLQ